MKLLRSGSKTIQDHQGRLPSTRASRLQCVCHSGTTHVLAYVHLPPEGEADATPTATATPGRSAPTQLRAGIEARVSRLEFEGVGLLVQTHKKKATMIGGSPHADLKTVAKRDARVGMSGLHPSSR